MSRAGDGDGRAGTDVAEAGFQRRCGRVGHVAVAVGAVSNEHRGSPTSVCDHPVRRSSGSVRRPYTLTLSRHLRARLPHSYGAYKAAGNRFRIGTDDLPISSDSPRNVRRFKGDRNAHPGLSGEYGRSRRTGLVSPEVPPSPAGETRTTSESDAVREGRCLRRGSDKASADRRVRGLRLSVLSSRRAWPAGNRHGGGWLLAMRRSGRS